MACRRPYHLAAMSRRWLAAQAIAVGVALAVCLAYLRSRGIFNLDNAGADMNAYWQAALRVRAHEPMYPPLADINASDVFRYPAWFAYPWVPLTLAPKVVVTTVWIGSLLAASVLALLPSLRSRSVAGLVLALLMAPILAEAAWLGNVEPLLVAGLVWGIGTRAEPVAIALAAATKLTPIAFISVPLARRDWVGAATTAAIVGALMIPSFLFDISNYPAAIGGTMSLWTLEPIWWALSAAASFVCLGFAVWRRSRFVVLVAALVTLTAPPRMNLLNIPKLLAGTGSQRSRPGR